MIPPDAARILAGLGVPAGAPAGRDPDAAAGALLARLTTAAAAGTPVPARVEADLGHGLVRLLVDGQPLVAASPRPLAPGTQVRLTLVGTGPGQVPLVAIDTAPDAVEVSAPAARLQALGLTPGPAAQAVLTAFAREGAPLDRPRLQRAVAAVLAVAAAEGRAESGGGDGPSVPAPGGSAPRPSTNALPSSSSPVPGSPSIAQPGVAPPLASVSPGSPSVARPGVTPPLASVPPGSPSVARPGVAPSLAPELPGSPSVARPGVTPSSESTTSIFPRIHASTGTPVLPTRIAAGDGGPTPAAVIADPPAPG
ncbi:MAG: hypothetical protein RLZZ127_2828, partial [Planctomycetota bacterium]